MTALPARTRKGLPGSVAEIVPGALYAVGGAVPAEASVSWIRERSSGWAPAQCFVFRSAGEALIMDCGLPAHAGVVGAGLDALLEGLAPPKLLISRWEPDAMAGLPWLVERYRVPGVLSYAGLNPLDFFEGFEEAAARSQVDAAAGLARLVPILPGDLLSHGSMRIEVISPALRLLLTVWYYERTTRTLFTADAFAYFLNPFGPFPFLTEPSEGAFTDSVVRGALLAKFDWLAGAHVDAVIADLEGLLARLSIERICPTIGGVIEGEASVRRAFQATIDTIRALSREPRKSAIEGFDWSRALNPRGS